MTHVTSASFWNVLHLGFSSTCQPQCDAVRKVTASTPLGSVLEWHEKWESV